jgi:16S rRNA (uracil1498-N3)-methyltransferase
MRLTRVYHPAALEPGSLVELPRPIAEHLVRVLRARPGDEFVLFGGDGRECSATLLEVRGLRVTATIGAARIVDRESPLAITLYQCVARGDRMDFIVQKATELGVARIVPVLSQRSVVRLDAAQARSKAEHWQAVAVSACEQCGRNRVPGVEAPRALLPVLGELGAGGVRLLLDAEGSESSAPPRPADGAVAVAIGPEGGFTAEEREAFAVCRFLPVRLGPRILRTETAALAALTWLQTLFGDL